MARQIGDPPRRVTLDVYGSGGTPVLLLHGIPGWRGTWRKVAPLIASDRLVLAPDLVGFGESQRLESDIHLATQTAMLVDLLADLRIGDVHVVGFDFGGPIAVSLVASLGRRVQSLALANTNVFTDTPIPLPLRVASVPVIGELAFRIFFGRVGLGLMYFGAVKDRSAFPRAEYERALHHDSAVAATRDVFFSSMRDLRRRYASVEATLPRVDIPTVVAWGTSDPFFSMGAGVRTADAIMGAQLVRLPGSGHFVPEERPNEFAEAIRANLAVAERTAPRDSNSIAVIVAV